MYKERDANLSMSVGEVVDDMQLCFNKAHFNRRDFSVDRFVNLARRRATLDVIHNDLRTYLRFLQNSMIELINDDYADFVNLSSSLAVLKESIDKVSSGVQSFWTSFTLSTSEIQSSAQLVQHKCVELLANRKSQMTIRNRISLLLSIQRLSRSLENRPSALSSWLPKLTYLVAEVELWNSRVPENKIVIKAVAARQACYSRIKKILIEELIADISGDNFNNISNILQLLLLIGKVDVAVSKVASSCVSSQINAPDGLSKTVMLTSFFDQLLQLRRKWVDLLKEQAQLNGDTLLFLDKTLLQFASGFLDEKFGSVFVPSDPSLFHKCHKIAVNFVTAWASESASVPTITALKSIISKFNIVVYFKMITQQCQKSLKHHSKESEFSYEDGVTNECRCLISRTILSSLEKFYGDESVYLPVLVDRLWNFTLKCLSNYADWVKLMNGHFRAKDDDKSLEYLIVLANDSKKFGTKFHGLYDDMIKQRLRELGLVDLTATDACVSIFLARIETLGTEILESIVMMLSTNATNKLSIISEIPRQYRWTKKPAPTCSSFYLNTTFSVCETFATKAAQFEWAEADVKNVLSSIVDQLSDVFCEKAEKMLESVEQTGTSLQRFKRKMQQQNVDTGIIPVNDADTDEAKIRAQLAFDVSFMQQRATEHGVNTTKLQMLSSRISHSDVHIVKS